VSKAVWKLFALETGPALRSIGQGPPLVLVVGAFTLRAAGQPLAEALAPDHTVFTYDRRGRGDSTDTAPYAVAREIDDLRAVIEAAGGSAAVFGYSSGAMLGLHAAAAGLSITRLALYEAPYLPPGAAADISHTAALAGLVDAGRRGEAVEYFQTRVVGIPAATVAQMRTAPFRPVLEAMAHTHIRGDAAGRSRAAEGAGRAGVCADTRHGRRRQSRVMSSSAQSLASILSNAQLLILAGLTHDLPAAIHLCSPPRCAASCRPGAACSQPATG
jgi:pimeloyl-ACP methyl ester carboxylesterase